jgi:DNA-binding NarL/FixJ family response regulator
MFTALIVQDNILFRQSLKEMLCNRYPAMRVKEATNGAEALRIIDAALPDLIFMDVRLPGANGLDITRKIKRDNPKVPVIIVASYDFAEYRDAAYQCGADFFVPEGSSIWEEITLLVEAVLMKSSLLIAGSYQEGA